MVQRFRILLLFVFVFLVSNANAAVNDKLTSIFYGNGGFTMNEIENLTLWTGKRPVVTVLFTNWCAESINLLFNIQLHNIWNHTTIPLITWQMIECGGQSQPGITKLVNNHTFDMYINQFSDRLKIWLSGKDEIYGTNDDRRAYLRLAHEMNGNWYPWSQNSTPNDYILAWRHVYDIFSSKSLDSTRLQWIWSVNNIDYSKYTAEDYWVGENYVDWLGIDGYNFGDSKKSPWVWPNQVLDNMIGRIRKLSSTKPLSINEYGCSSMRAGNISDIKSKTEWLNQFCNYINQNGIKMASYFNIEKENNWAIFGGTYGDTIWNNLHAYTAYRNCLQSNDWIQPNSSNPRLITNDQFAGRL